MPDKALSYPADQVIYHGFSGPPRVRFGSYPSANIGTFFIGPDLGTHGYCYRISEKDGIAYTCRGGTIDVIHVRIAADWTAYLAAATYRHLMNHDNGFSYGLAVDRSKGIITFSYPDNWNSLPKIQQMAIAKEVALVVGPYLTFTMTSWHEILTWYGFKCMGPFPEFPSAFSWEDSYSNLIGTMVGARALQDPQHKYNDAVKIAIDEEMQKLGILSGHAAKRATETMRGKWWTGNVIFAVDMKKRNFDIGLKDGYVTPTLIPNVPECPRRPADAVSDPQARRAGQVRLRGQGGDRAPRMGERQDPARRLWGWAAEADHPRGAFRRHHARHPCASDGHVRPGIRSRRHEDTPDGVYHRSLTDGPPAVKLAGRAARLIRSEGTPDGVTTNATEPPNPPAFDDPLSMIRSKG